MSEKDLHEELIRSYEFASGTIPHREEFKQVLEETFSPAELRVIFLFPLVGETTMEELEEKAGKAGIPVTDLRAAMERLLTEGLAQTYETSEGRVYQRGILISLIELQIRKPADSRIRQVCAEIMDAMHEGESRSLPTKTPYYRVLPVESTLMAVDGAGGTRVDAVVPDPRAVLPIDVITEMIKREPLVALTDCACRKAKQVLGKGCEHPLQTCLAFNKYAQALMRSGIAHQIDHEEAIAIVRQGEALGLVHNVSNCQEHIEFICNCCPCSCGLMASLRRGQTNALAPSRYVVAMDRDECTLCETCVEICPVNAVRAVDGAIAVEYERCIGCGLCVSACPQGARRMELRGEAPDIPADSRALNERITGEAMAAIASQ